MTAPAVAPEETAAAREILARAEKRLTAMIARRGIDDMVLRVAGIYERMHDAATLPADDGLLDLVCATTDPAEVPRLVVLPSVIGGVA